MDKKYIIYCDMDGVLVDFNMGYFELTGVDISGQYHTSKSFWSPIDKAGVSFWENLNWTSDGKELWNYIEKHKPTLLSAPSIKDDSKVGKHNWVKRELPGTKLILRKAENKRLFASPKAILIDDRLENIQGWIESNGIGILHTNTQDTIKRLMDMGI
jgi:hypothetical protein